MFVNSWKIFPVFAQEKEFVIKLLKILKWLNCSVQATASLGVARRLLEMKKKSVEENFSGVLQCVKQEKKIFKINIFGSTEDMKHIYIYIYIYIFVVLQ